MCLHLLCKLIDCKQIHSEIYVIISLCHYISCFKCFKLLLHIFCMFDNDDDDSIDDLIDDFNVNMNIVKPQ